MKVLPTYFNPGRLCDWNPGTNTRSSTSKREKWLIKAKNENFEFKKTKSTMKQKQTVKINDNPCKKLKKQQQYNNIINDNGNEKDHQLTKQPKNTTKDCCVLDNPFISDKLAFDNWYQKTYKKSIIEKILKTPATTTNYYNCLNLDEDNITESTKNIITTTKMPLLVNKTYSAPVFDASTEETGYTSTEHNEEDWTISN
jgi:hypothetical protein